MKPNVRNAGAGFAFFAGLLCCLHAASAQDPFPSWNEGKSKQSIIQFVQSVTKKNSSDFVPITERIATFDNDGTL